MKINVFLSAAVSLAIGLGACQSQPEYCIVKGSVKGLEDGTKLVLQDEFDHYREFVSTRVKDGAYEFRPRISAPTHVYLFTKGGKQLKDFFLEPGTLVVDVDVTDEEDWAAMVTGTPANDLLAQIHQLRESGDKEAARALWDEVIQAEETGVLALFYADDQNNPAAVSLGILDRLAPELAAKPYIAELREVLTRRAKVEPAPEGSGRVNYYIDLDYSDIDGNPVRLSSVVEDPAVRYVILDFWATWCDPCREAIPELRALYDKFHAKGLEIYSVSEDPYIDEWKAFLSEAKLPWINVLDDKAGRKSQARKDYVFNGIPTVLLIDGETGAIIMRDQEDELDAILSSLLP